MQLYKGIGTYGTVGLDLVVSTVVGLLGGRWLDQKLGTHGWLTIIGLLLGVAAGFNLLFKAAKQMRREAEQEETPPPIRPPSHSRSDGTEDDEHPGKRGA